MPKKICRNTNIIISINSINFINSTSLVMYLHSNKNYDTT